MSDLCFQLSVAGYVMAAGFGLGSGVILTAILAVEFREWRQRAAIAMETRRAETTGSVGEADDSAAIAQNKSGKSA